LGKYEKWREREKSKKKRKKEKASYYHETPINASISSTFI